MQICKFLNYQNYISYFISKPYSIILRDSTFLKLKYKLRTGKKLNLKAPKTFNEKMQWLKIHNRKPLYTQMADKFAARELVKKVIGSEHLIPVYGVWEHAKDIDFSMLPDQFVLKCNHDCGSVVICKDKRAINQAEICEKLETSLKDNYFWHGREWPYRDIEPKIMAEKYVGGATGITDYKFFCFDKVPKFLYISTGLEDHATAQISFFDLNLNRMPFRRNDYHPLCDNYVFPDNFLEMKQIAERLANVTDTPFIRVDLYSIEGQIYFSEFTFFPCGGMLPFEPDEWDEKLGAWVHLSGIEL